MKVRQYVYFAIRSDTVTADEMTMRIGLAPDRVLVRGSRHDHPTQAVPRRHVWELRCDRRRLHVGAQIGEVLERLAPARDALRALVDDEDVSATLQVVRQFGDQDGDLETLTLDERGEPRDQLWLFGWHLDYAALAFLVEVGADLDVDEYDLLDDEAEQPDDDTMR